MKTLVTFVLLAFPAQAENWVWKWSVAAIAAGTVADVSSSWGMHEANPMLGARFGARSAAIKCGITGGLLAVQYVALRRHRGAAKHAAITNFVVAGGMSAAAVHNWRLRADIRPAPLRTR